MVLQRAQGLAWWKHVRGSLKADPALDSAAQWVNRKAPQSALELVSLSATEKEEK